MNSNSLLAVERTTLLLAVATTVAAALAWGVAGAGAAALGGAVAFANLTVTRRLAGRAVGKVLGGANPAAVGLGAGMMLKMVLLFPILWVAVSVLHVPVAPFAAGLSVMIVSLVVVGLWTATRGEAA
jgi:hypothetical protein